MKRPEALTVFTPRRYIKIRSETGAAAARSRARPGEAAQKEERSLVSRASQLTSTGELNCGERRKRERREKREKKE